MTTTTARSSRHPLALLALAVVLAACGTSPSPSQSAPPTIPPSLLAVASPGEPLGALPAVEGVAYRTELNGIAGFVGNSKESIGEDVEIEIVQSVVATRGDDAVSIIAFGFPGATDTEAVDYFARIIDKMEDGFGAGSQRGLDGRAYVMTADDRSVVLAPWGRLEYLVFLFAVGPADVTEGVVTGILDAER
jgi:hypothetical protein